MAALIQILENHLNQKGRQLSNLHQRVMLKEILQSYVLSFLYNHKDYRFLNFYGGTCLRVIYNLNRMSEDIDLDNSRQVKTAGKLTSIHWKQIYVISLKILQELIK